MGFTRHIEELRKSRPSRVEGDRKEFWGQLAQDQSRSNPLLNKSLAKFKKEGMQPDIAVDLGCGNSGPAIDLLKDGWEVIAVDNSEQVLANLRRSVCAVDQSWITTGRLRLVCEDMETYQFPKDVRIILAKDSFPYCDPKKFKIIWGRIYDSLGVGGCIIENLFPMPEIPASAMIGDPDLIRAMMTISMNRSLGM